jgi:preprotein translocase subunit SecD
MLVILGVLAYAVYSFVPMNEKVKLGLDLKGGMHLVLEVQTKDAIRINTDQQIIALRDLLKDSSIAVETVRSSDINRFEVAGYAADQEQRVRDILDDEFPDWNRSMDENRAVMTLKPNIQQRMEDQAVEKAMETVRNRIDEFGVAEAGVQKYGIGSGNKILVLLPGVDDPNRVKSLIKSTAMLEFKHVEAGPFSSEEEAKGNYAGKIPEDMILYKMNPRRADGRENMYYVLQAATVVPGKDVRNANRSMDEYGGPAVSFSLNNQGSSKMEKYSAANVGQRMAIVLDNRIESVATIQSVLSYDIQIIGRFTPQEVDDLILTLRSGALPASMKYLETRSVGPSLGADSIRKGIMASQIGMVLVIIFMLIYYRGAGINSVVALLLNMVILLGVLAAFKATLTLPGIAGVVLTIGMSVDANVLIFERIKEELRFGKAPKAAIEQGFAKAFSTIMDSNLTTVISAIFLFQFGTGPIKGFAVTLIIGIVASMFTAIFVSRVIFDLTYGSRKKLEKISI